MFSLFMLPAYRLKTPEPPNHPSESIRATYLAACAVKFAKPCALATSATLRPPATNGCFRDWAELAFSTSEPRTAGSIRGRMPRSCAVAGRVASLHRAGIDCAEGLKFFSAATS